MTHAARGLRDRTGKGFDAGRFFGVVGKSFDTLDEWKNALARGYILLSNRAMDSPEILDESMRDALYTIEVAIEAIIAAEENAATTTTTKHTNK